MRAAAVFVPLLLCLQGAQCDDEGATGINVSRTDMQEVQGKIWGHADHTLNVWAELKELRDMVIEQKVELNNSKGKVGKLEQETAGEARVLTQTGELECSTHSWSYAQVILKIKLEILPAPVFQNKFK